MGLLRFFIDLIHPVALGLTQPLAEMSIRGIFLGGGWGEGGKGSHCLGPTTLPL